MLAVQTWIQSRWMDFRDDRGASLVEYALLLVLIAVVAILPSQLLVNRWTLRSTSSVTR